MWTNFPSMAAELNKVSQLLEQVAEESPEAIKNDISRLLLSHGKMLRPAFVLLSSSWGREKPEGLYSVAAAIELLHIATLVHDDVLDGAAKRRGIKTLHTSMGVKNAVLIGDYLLSVSLKLAAGEYVKDLMPVLLEGVTNLCLSEIDQDFNPHKLDISRESYYGRIRGKTAELFGISCFAGAVVAGSDKAIADRLYELGISFGMAFQIDDDVLDYTGRSGRMGKRTGRDLKAGIPTLPFLEALWGSDSLAEKYVKFPLKTAGAPYMQKHIVRSGYADKAKKVADDYLRAAVESVDSLEERDASSVFRDMFKLLRTRDF